MELVQKYVQSEVEEKRRLLEMELVQRYVQSIVEDRKEWVDNFVILSYANEGQMPKYLWVLKDRVDTIINIWKETGMIIHKEKDYYKGSVETIKEEAEQLSILEPNHYYIRRKL